MKSQELLVEDEVKEVTVEDEVETNNIGWEVDYAIFLKVNGEPITDNVQWVPYAYNHGKNRMGDKEYLFQLSIRGMGQDKRTVIGNAKGGRCRKNFKKL